MTVACRRASPIPGTSCRRPTGCRWRVSRVTSSCSSCAAA
ncbi:UNVERIFIED_CONTAM: hypothetical protein NCL1_62339 [Trichonephila clavipes]